jgi:site-specific recombinase XerC
VTALGWRAYFTRRGLPRPVADADLLGDPAGLDLWLDEHGVPDGQPFLLDPLGRYDVVLNLFFAAELFAEPRNTQLAVAHDLKRFLTFLWENRGERSWLDAGPEDRAAFKRWRLFDPAGPHVECSTWDREVATVNRFYQWAVRRGQVKENPIVQRESRVSASWRAGRREVPAEASRTGPRRRIAWLTPAMYSQWRDAGVRGLDPHGRPDPGFRGRFASRNAAYTDLMFRTGLRLAEQTSLSLFEMPELADGMANARAWLPARIAKGGSARHFYIPAPVLRDVLDYVEMERAEAVDRGRASGVYERIRDRFIVEDPGRPRVRLDGRWEPVAKLDPHERLRLLVDTGSGLAPAALWLTERGLPSRPAGWQQVFGNANDRCRALGIGWACHPHMLRHSFAVITLEQLWRGHLRELAGMVPAQRMTYQMVYGDPLNWVRQRLGHASILTTQIYQHTLHELEMETRMALIPDMQELAGVCPGETGASVTA